VNASLSTHKRAIGAQLLSSRNCKPQIWQKRLTDS
jgi:hypothetical protein